MKNQDLDKRQEQLKERKYERWLKWLRKPQTLSLLFKLGPVIFQLLKWLIELWQD